MAKTKVDNSRKNLDKNSSKWNDIVLGIALIIFGIFFLSNPYQTFKAFVQFLGFFWIAVGISIIATLTKNTDESRHWIALKAILDIILGLIIFSYPYIVLLFIPTMFLIVLAIWGTILGVVGIVEGIYFKETTRIILGILGIIISFIIFATPVISAIYLVILTGIISIPAGIILIIKPFLEKVEKKK